jgi:type 1 glutamine amidotransferase
MWGGGPYHPYPAITEVLRTRLGERETELVYTEDTAAFADPALAEAPLVIFAGLHWSGVTRLGTGDHADVTWDPPQSATTTYRPLADDELSGLIDFVARGGALLCQHPGMGSFADDRPELAELWDGRYVVGQSRHTEDWTEPIEVSIAGDHPVTRGLGSFEVFDELYHDFVEPTRSAVLLTGSQLGLSSPLAWARADGAGRVAVCLIGHDLRAYGSPGFHAFHGRLLDWLLA